MIFHRNDITPSRPLSFDETFAFGEVEEKAYPLLGIASCAFQGEISKIDGILHVIGHIRAKLFLSDARSLKKVDYDLNKNVEFDLLASEEEDGDGYVFEENKIDLKEVAYCLILTHMPKAYSKEKSLPASGEGYTVISEGEEEGLGNAFSALNPDDFA